MLGLCHKLGKDFGADPLFFQIGFVVWFAFTPVALIVYLFGALILVD